MADLDSEPFANPIAPSGHKKQPEASQPAHPLSNDDFRKLIQTPRVGSGLASTSVRKQHHESASVRGRKPVFPSKDSSDEKPKKKTVSKPARPQEDNYLVELAQRYRDRAKERREGANPDYQIDEAASSAAGYRAIPDLKSVADVAERRKQIIEESKYLGGDMEHTHLVKGLDYALLQKVKAELQQHDDEEQNESDKDEDDDVKDVDEVKDVEDEGEDRWAVKSKMAVNIVNLINQKLPDRNELFLPQRMAYVVNLEDESFDDIPTTIIRSRVECSNSESSTLTTNDIVMNKLIQIWSYFRQGGSKKQKLKQTAASSTQKPDAKPTIKKENIEDSIYGDIGDYVPSAPKHRKFSKESTSALKYFGSSKSNPDAGEVEQRPSTSKVTELVQDVHHARSKVASKIDNEPEGYAECYPGAAENEDAVIDSDDEADYSKMDAGSKKGGVGRWDFETTEEYSDYMGSKEALPKAAYQFGLKMSDGRKTKKGAEKKKDYNAKLDRDLQKINAIMKRRKEEGSKGDHETARKNRM